MREADRSLAERVSVLDRGPRAFDRLAVESGPPSLTRYASRLDRVRLAFEVRGCKVLVGRDDDDGVHLMVSDIDGGGRCGSRRSALSQHGAVVMITSNAWRVLVAGLVADEVTAVRVGDVPAFLRNNGFLAEISSDDSPVIVVATRAGEREVGPSAP